MKTPLKALSGYPGKRPKHLPFRHSPLAAGQFFAPSLERFLDSLDFHNHSVRSARIGSVLDAILAGITLATKALTISAADASRKIAGSYPLTS
jgi:hypothetical protein